MDTIGNKLFLNEDMDVTIFSDPINLNNMLHVSLHASWSGATANGTLYYEICGELGQPTNWEVYDSATVSGSGTQLWVDRNVPYLWARLRYVPASGTGTINADAVTKGDQ
jgi:hypothetical protein